MGRGVKEASASSITIYSFLKRSKAMRQKIGLNKADVWVLRVLLGFSLDFAVLEIFN